MGDKNKEIEFLKKQIYNARKQLIKSEAKDIGKESFKDIKTPIKYTKKTYNLLKKNLFPTVTYDEVKQMFKNYDYGARTDQVRRGKITPAAKFNKAIIGAGKNALAGVLWAVANAPEAAYDYVVKPATAAAGGLAGTLYEDIKDLPKQTKRMIQDLDLAISSPEAKNARYKLGKALGFHGEPVKNKDYETYLNKLKNIIKNYQKNKLRSK